MSIFVQQSTIIMTKYTNIKSTCTKKSYMMTAKEVANMVGCSQSYVKQVREGRVNLDTPLVQRIVAIDAIGAEGKNLLIEEVKRLVKID